MAIELATSDGMASLETKAKLSLNANSTSIVCVTVRAEYSIRG